MPATRLHQIGPRYMVHHVAVNMGHCIVAFGYDLLDQATCIQVRVIFTYNLYTNQWRKHEMPQMQAAPGSVICACAAVIGLHAYMFGGCFLRDNRDTNSLWKLTIDPQGSFVWSEIITSSNEKAPSPRSGHSGWEYGLKLWIFAGRGPSPNGYLNENGDYFNGYNNQILCYNPPSEQWTNPRCHGSVPEPCAWQAATTHLGKAWVYGGQNSLVELFDDLYELHLNSCTYGR